MFDLGDSSDILEIILTMLSLSVIDKVMIVTAYTVNFSDIQRK